MGSNLTLTSFFDLLAPSLKFILEAAVKWSSNKALKACRAAQSDCPPYIVSPSCKVQRMTPAQGGRLLNSLMFNSPCAPLAVERLFDPYIEITTSLCSTLSTFLVLLNIQPKTNKYNFMPEYRSLSLVLVCRKVFLSSIYYYTQNLRQGCTEMWKDLSIVNLFSSRRTDIFLNHNHSFEHVSFKALSNRSSQLHVLQNAICWASSKFLQKVLKLCKAVQWSIGSLF